VLKTFSAPPLIISVGNLNTGGTGKTPMIEYLINTFQGKKIAILSRGYKRKTKGFIIANKSHSAENLGDEMRQLCHKFPNTIIACDNNRVNGVKKILEHNQQVDVVLLDDAFQHRQLNRDINILLSEYNNLFLHDQLLPIGQLRECRSEYKRADIIIITKCPNKISLKDREEIRTRINLYNHQKIYFSYINKYKYLHMGSLKSVEINSKKTHIILTGIASTQTILTHLKNKKINYIHLKFADHYDFKDKDIFQIIALKNDIAISKNLLLTEKDYYRLSEDHKKKLQNHFHLICIQIGFDFIETYKSNFNDELLNFKKSKL